MSLLGTTHYYQQRQDSSFTAQVPKAVSTPTVRRTRALAHSSSQSLISSRRSRPKKTSSNFITDRPTLACIASSSVNLIFHPSRPSYSSTTVFPASLRSTTIKLTACIPLSHDPRPLSFAFISSSCTTCSYTRILQSTIINHKSYLASFGRRYCQTTGPWILPTRARFSSAKLCFKQAAAFTSVPTTSSRRPVRPFTRSSQSKSVS